MLPYKVFVGNQEWTTNMTEEREGQLLNVHAPLGIPIDLRRDRTTTLSNSSNHILLVNEDFLTGKELSGTYQIEMYILNYFKDSTLNSVSLSGQLIPSLMRPSKTSQRASGLKIPVWTSITLEVAHDSIR